MRILRSPGRYIQGRDAILSLGEHISAFGKNVFVITTENGRKRFEGVLQSALTESGFQLTFGIQNGECTVDRVEMFRKEAGAVGCQAVVGLGGGKVIDSAKAVGDHLGLPIIVIPTVASTDAPCSSLSIIYRENGEFDHYLFLKKSPEIVLVDTTIIMKAPARFLVYGMGDALATYFEARAVWNAGKNNQTGGKPTHTARNMAELCYRTLLEDGLKAKLSAEAGVITKAFENIVEVNTLLSGIGFESGGLAAAHALQKGLSFIPELYEEAHGAKVAFGALVQLVLENADRREIESVVEFCEAVGLPVTLADLGYAHPDHDLLKKAAQMACVRNATIHNMPFEIKEEDVYDAILAADRIGAHYQREKTR